MVRDVRSRPLKLGAALTAATALLLFGFGVAPTLVLPAGGSLLEWVRDPQWFVLNLAALVMAPSCRVFGAGNMVPVIVRGLGSVVAALALALLARSLWRRSQAAGS